MSLIVESGNGDPNSDSYISLIDARAWALKFGYSLDVDDDKADVQLRKGAIDVDLNESSFAGSRLNDTQSLAWVRINSYKCSGKNQISLPPDEVPNEAKYAQVIYADAYNNGVDVRANNDGLAIASETVVGAVAVSYFDNGKTGGSITITKAIDMLNSLMCVGSSPFSIPTVRT